MKRIFYTAPSYTKSFFFLFFLAFSAGLSAQTASLSVQGVLTRSDGTAVDDGNDYVLTFRLWTEESGGTKVHEETINNISIVGGVYSVVLGVTPGNPPLTAQFNQTYWLGVSVNTSSVELLPRPRLTHAPYALAIVGNNNVFPSTGTVKADALKVNGAVDAQGFRALGGAPTNSNGYSFSTGDTDGGIFSLDDNNVSIFANNVKALEATNTVVNIPVDLISGSHTINGNQQINGSSNITNGQTVNNGQTINGTQTINGNSNTTGYITSDLCMLTDFAQGGGGYCFKDDPNFDTGLFSYGEGKYRLLANGQSTIEGNTGGVRIDKDLYLTSAPNMTDGDNLEWRSNVQGGRVGVNTSSRRYKYNIQPLKVDFTRMLQVEPRIYNRKSEGDDKWEIGYIAEEIDSLGMKDLVLYDEQGRPNSLIYKKFIIYTNELVKMQHKDIENLKAEVIALTNEIKQLQTANNNLQTANTNLKGTNTTLQEQQTAFSAQLDILSKRIRALEISGTGK